MQLPASQAASVWLVDVVVSKPACAGSRPEVAVSQVEHRTQETLTNVARHSALWVPRCEGVRVCGLIHLVGHQMGLALGFCLVI
eukprot:358956-Chlamydomonas_euryale.AAC.4